MITKPSWKYLPFLTVGSVPRDRPVLTLVVAQNAFRAPFNQEGELPNDSDQTRAWDFVLGYKEGKVSPNPAEGTYPVAMYNTDIREGKVTFDRDLMHSGLCLLTVCKTQVLDRTTGRFVEGHGYLLYLPSMQNKTTGYGIFSAPSGDTLKACLKPSKFKRLADRVNATLATKNYPGFTPSI